MTLQRNHHPLKQKDNCQKSVLTSQDQQRRSQNRIKLWILNIYMKGDSLSLPNICHSHRRVRANATDLRTKIHQTKIGFGLLQYGTEKAALSCTPRSSHFKMPIQKGLYMCV